jgi:hypothetical protein
MKHLMDFCKNCGLILIWEEQIGPHLKKVAKIGLTKVFLYNTDDPKEADAYLIDEFTREDPDGVDCPKCGADLSYEENDAAEFDDTCSICKKPAPGQYFQGCGGVCFECENTPEGSALLEQLLKKWEYESSDGFLARKVDEELQKLDANETNYPEKRKSLLVQLLYYNVKSINKKYGL